MNYPEFSEKGEVICQECGKEIQIITGSHLRKHGMTKKDYTIKYPNAPLSGQRFHLTMKHYKAKSLTTEEKKYEDPSQEVDEVLDGESAPTIEEIKELIKDQDFSDLVESQSRIPPVPEVLVDPLGQTPKDKLQLISFIRKRFPFAQNNYMIKKFNTHTTFLDYEIITDIADPISKVDFEFPNAFWHNRMPLEDVHRNLKLTRDGWKVLTITDRAPRVEHVKELMSKVL